ncbi:acetyltransferase [Pseudomonas sp. HR96]|uniref:acetyltransferase n=1 Tax=Pseudomonas sp. HR96 TaxID=1027966 RepID=UPI002A74BFFB|nr:acetyltransferase [Pseudomonas sp. HR96]WPP00069.1 acetyltransferase [Pseudomonas sp. HR96]
MHDLIIIGAGGCGRQVLSQLRLDPAHGVAWRLGGFLDERGPEVVDPILGLPWLGDPASFQPAVGQRLVVAVGDTRSRQRQVAALLARGAQFERITSRCFIGERSQVGRSFIGLDVSTGSDCRLGDFGFIDIEARLGHDVVLEDFVQMGPRCLLAGHVHVERGATLHSAALVARGVRIGAGATVGLGAVVLQDVPAGATVVGNPARVVFHRDVNAGGWP